MLQNTPSPRAGRYAQRRNDKQARASDIFGDFFGFGPNPPGCLSKGAAPIDLKAEKAKFLELLSSEAKRYDIQGMHFDLNTKMEQIVKAIKKEEKIIMNDEERQLRNLDKLEYMSQYLNEDHIMTQNSLQEAQKIRDQSKLEMNQVDKENNKELQQLEMQVRQMQELIENHQSKQQEVQSENVRLLKQIQDGRVKDVQQNQKVIDNINIKDREFDNIAQQVIQEQKKRRTDLAKYNQECDNASMQTQKSENMLKEKETQRQTVQQDKQSLEKKLSQLSEKNLKEQSVNYQLSYRHKYFTQKSSQSEKRIAMLQDKLKYMTSTLNKQIKEQADRANEIDVESKKLKMEISRQKDEVAIKGGELKKLNDSNEGIKKVGYERKIEELNRQLYNLDKQRTEFQMKLESTHASWTCKLQLFVTDMNSQSEKTQRDLQQINDLLNSMTAVSEKQAGLLQQRQNLLLENFEQAEKSELTNHLSEQIQYCD